MKQRLKSFAVIAIIVAATLGLPLSVNAIDRATIRRFAENNILFYDPDSIGGCSSASKNSTALEGITPKLGGSDLDNAKTTIAELINTGYSPIAAAAIAGNLEWEGGFYPCKVENGSHDGVGNTFNSGVDCDKIHRGMESSGSGNSYILSLLKGGNSNAGFGIVQWTTPGRKQKLIDTANSKGVKVTDLGVQIQVLIEELQTWNAESHPSTVSALNNIANGEDGLIQATWRIYRYFEAPAASFKWEGGTGEFHGDQNKKQPTDPLSLNKNDHAGAYHEFYETRLPAALYYLNMLEAGGSVAPGKTQPQISGSDVLIVTNSDSKESLVTALSTKMTGAQVEDAINGERKYIIYMADMFSSISLDESKKIMESVSDEQVIFFVNYEVSTINAIKQLATEKENAKIVEYDSENDSQMVDKIYKAIQTVVSAKGRSYDPCVGGTVNGVTTKMIDGKLYAFPLAGTTKQNYIRNALSGFCALSAEQLKTYYFAKANGDTAHGWCGTHHDYPAVDIGRSVNGSSDSIGAPVVAFVSGTLVGYGHYGAVQGTKKWNTCSHATIEDKDGVRYWIGHMKYDSSKESLVNTQVEAGVTVLGEVGDGICGVWEEGGWTTPHLHVDERCDRVNGTITTSSDGQWFTTSEQYLCMPHRAHDPSSYAVTTHLNYLMTQLWDEVPEQ